MAGIGLLLSPRAKRHQKDPQLAARLARQLGHDGVVGSAHNLEQLGEVVEDFKRQGVDLVAVAGGDGTNHVTIAGLIEVYGESKLPYFAMLRGGTMNTVANAFGIPLRSPERLLARYQRAYRRRASHPLKFVEPNVMRVGHHVGFIFGTGAIYGFIAEYNRHEVRSPLWAAQVLTRTVVETALTGHSRVAMRWHGEVRFDDGSAFPMRDYLTVGASTCGQIGLGFSPFYRSNERPDHFHMLGIHASARSAAAGLPRVWLGRTLGAQKTYERLATRAVLRAQSGNVAYMLDGDVYEHKGELELAIGPRLRIVIP